MIEQFIDKRFSASSLAIIEQANAILREYDQQGLVLTLRQTLLSVRLTWPHAEQADGI